VAARLSAWKNSPMPEATSRVNKGRVRKGVGALTTNTREGSVDLRSLSSLQLVLSAAFCAFKSLALALAHVLTI
jgi:hypothetical protein